MLRYMMKSKIHRALVTGTVLEYEGSIKIDMNLLRDANILPGEQVHVLNLNNGSRMETYAIEGEAGSGVMELNGPAARLGEIGDKIIVISYASYTPDELAHYSPCVIFVDDQNRRIQS